MEQTQATTREYLRRIGRENKYVMAKIADLKAADMHLADQDDVFNMGLSEFLEWFDRNAIRLFKSVAYSRIKNRHDYEFADYVRDRKLLRKAVRESKSKVSLVRRNSKLRTSFKVHEGPLLVLGSTSILEGAFAVQSFPHTVDDDLKYCIQFSGRFKKVADQFCEDIKPEAVYRALQNVKSTAIYHKKSDEIISY